MRTDKKYRKCCRATAISDQIHNLISPNSWRNITNSETSAGFREKWNPSFYNSFSLERNSTLGIFTDPDMPIICIETRKKSIMIRFSNNWGSSSHVGRKATRRSAMSQSNTTQSVKVKLNISQILSIWFHLNLSQLL